MRPIERLQQGIITAQPRDIHTLRYAVTGQFHHFKERLPTDKLFFVSGAVNADGEKYRDRNRALLLAYTARLNEMHDDTHFFTSATVVMPDIRENIGIMHLPDKGYQLLVKLWRSVLTSGYVDGIVLTPGWHRSTGAKDEKAYAERSGLTIIDWDKQPELIPQLDPQWEQQFLPRSSVLAMSRRG